MVSDLLSRLTEWGAWQCALPSFGGSAGSFGQAASAAEDAAAAATWATYICIGLDSSIEFVKLTKIWPFYPLNRRAVPA